MKLFLIAVLCLCGTNADKIIGGTAGSTGQFPSIVFQEKSGSFFCGGTLIGYDKVLSAAHCEQNLVGLTVTAGTAYRSSGGVTKPVARKVVHTGYNSNTLQNDIMLLYTSTSFSLGTNINTASLVFTAPSAGTGITVAGWGDTNSGIISSLPNQLEYVNVAVISTSTCNAWNAYNGAVTSGMICMGNMSGGEDSCQGDSGGPAYIQGTTTIAGITSWGYGCAQANQPGVYTDVAHYRSWINNN
uniref:trypsin alpha-3-like n=1 Tax=Styela clava TaxID=7725 RepID=UPI00193A25E2|nr:trypsin alpha-3-like [Styela clava]